MKTLKAVLFALIGPIVVLVIMAACKDAFGQSYSLAPVAVQTFLDTSGNPISAAKLCTYAAGTTTPLATYTNSTGTSAGVMVTTDAYGRATIYLAASTSYKFVLRSASATNCSTGSILWTQDYVTAAGGSSGTISGTADYVSKFNATGDGVSNSTITDNGSIIALGQPTTIATSVTVPKVIGGAAAGSTLTLQSTSGSGSADTVSIKTGNNGGTTHATFGTEATFSTPINIMGSTGVHFGSTSANRISTTAGDLFINLGGSERARLTSNGQMYVGLTTTDIGGATSRVVVNGSGGGGFITTSAETNATFGGLTVSAADYVSIISGKTGSGTARPLVFFVNAAERMRLSTSGVMTLANYGDGTLSIVSTTVTSSSDERLKDISGKYRGGLKEVLGLEPIVYKWNALSKINSDRSYVGFSAQNVQKFIPAAVGRTRPAPDSDEQEYLTLDDRPLLAALVNAVKELNAKNAALEKRILALEK